jgi:hypothetical protein
VAESESWGDKGGREERLITILCHIADPDNELERNSGARVAAASAALLAIDRIEQRKLALQKLPDREQDMAMTDEQTIASLTGYLARRGYVIVKQTKTNGHGVHG